MCECKCSSKPSVSQSLDELDFERGLWFAAQYGDEPRALHLLQKGFEVNRKDAAGYTALHYAARNGHLSMCKLLVENGAFVDAITTSGKATALHRAATMGNYEIVKFLVEKNADCLLMDSDGKTVLHRAVQGNYEEICRFLVNIQPCLKYQTDKHNKKPIDYIQSENFKFLLD